MGWLQRAKRVLIPQLGRGQLSGRVGGIHHKTEECGVNLGVGRGRWGEGAGEICTSVEEVEEGGVLRRMSLLTHKRGLISRGGRTSYSGAERRYAAGARPQAPAHKGRSFGISEKTGAIWWLPPRGGQGLMSYGHVFISIMIDAYHPHRL